MEPAPLDDSNELNSSAGSEMKEVFVSPAEEQARPESTYSGIGKVVDDIDRSLVSVGTELDSELNKLITVARKDCVLF